MALMTAKELSNRGYNVLFLDRDLFSFASQIAKVGNSLFSQIAKGEEPKNYFIDIGNLTIVRLFGEGIIFYKDVEEIHRDSKKRDILEKIYEELVKRKDYKFFIVDNPPYVTMKSEVVEHELTMFTKLFPNVEIYRVYLTTDLVEDTETTKKYINELESTSIGKPLGLIVNMSTNKERGINVLRSLLDDRFLVGVVIPFIDELYQFNGRLEDLPIVPQIKEFVNAILNKERKIIS